MVFNGVEVRRIVAPRIKLKDRNKEERCCYGVGEKGNGSLSSILVEY